ncbi:hypothetical protein [Paenibacillus thalictri]|uniref:Uncharacterized protein n=1 Tax=Paenibacillus thalictri TaxID=2527873 RepID=A0A4Q9DDI7_9BACL|nr:hypothetical protein [Paenibacillus thalictri]TBL68287.1 hypothetical protein EYB31_38525 [Paenibacillus thalictri]
MAWKTIYENDHIHLVADEEQQQAMLEVSSGGYRPRYVTLQLPVAELDQLIAALQLAKQELLK